MSEFSLPNIWLNDGIFVWVKHFSGSYPLPPYPGGIKLGHSTSRNEHDRVRARENHNKIVWNPAGGFVWEVKTIMMKDEKREQYITMTPISAQWSRGGVQGDPNLPPPVPCNPCSHPFFLSFLPFALFQLRNIMQYNVISPISPASRPLELPPPALFSPASRSPPTPYSPGL